MSILFNSTEIPRGNEVMMCFRVVEITPLSTFSHYDTITTIQSASIPSLSRCCMGKRHIATLKRLGYLFVFLLLSSRVIANQSLHPNRDPQESTRHSRRAEIRKNMKRLQNDTIGGRGKFACDGILTDLSVSCAVELEMLFLSTPYWRRRLQT